MRFIFNVIITFIFVFDTVFAQGNIKDIIKPIKLTSGKESLIDVSDLFYSKNYSLDFLNSKTLTAKFIDSDSILLQSKDNFEGLTNFRFKVDNNLYDVPVIVKKEKLYNFSFKPDEPFKEIYLFGSFNGWNRKDIRMCDDDNDGIFTAKVALEPGVYQYKFFADEREIVDNKNPNKVPNGFGDFNSVITISENTDNKMFLHVYDYKSTSRYSTFIFYLESKIKNANKSNIYAYLDNKLLPQKFIKINGKIIAVVIPNKLLKGKQTLRAAVSVDGVVSNIQEHIIFDGKPTDNSHFNWNDAILYSIMIDRLYDGDKSINSFIKHDSLENKANYMGGDLQGIIDKINSEYFDSLGVNVIWISPVYDNPEEAFREYPAPHRYYSGYHGYWPISSQAVENRFGSFEKLKELVDTAHKHNIKILLDFVSNHVHKDHPFFKEHRDWFGKLELPNGKLNLRLWDEYRLTTWFEPYLPSFDYEGSKEALETMTDNAVWWLNQTGADGFRHDAVKHVPNIFWRTLTKKIKEKVAPLRNLDIYQIGETFGSYDLISSYVNNGQLSSQFNFNLYDVALPTFINSDLSFDGLNKEMHKTFSVYGNLHLMGNIMDSHDKNRFMSFADGDLDVSQWSAAEIGWNNPPQVDNPENYKKLILYMAYMNTIPGIPVVYYGSEFGMSGASDPDNRRMMRFGNQLTKYEKETLKEVKNIINTRKNHSALRYGDFYTLIADESVYAYLRSDFNERLFVVINKSKEQKMVSVHLPEFLKSPRLIDSKNNSIETTKNQIELTIPPQSWKIYLLK
mgnify:CR=1 FL=1